MTWPRLSAIPLRHKLIAAVLLLVTIALLLVGVVSVLSLRTYLVQRVDNQVEDVADALGSGSTTATRLPDGYLMLPSDYVVIYVLGTETVVNSSRDESGYPSVPSGTELEELDGQTFTVSSQGTTERWRILARSRPDGSYLLVGLSLAGSEDTVDRLIASELIVGIGLLAVLVSVGIGIVQASLRPLVEIEKTTAAIAAGDLTQRVPEADPNTEVGHLATAFNTMLAHIEIAFDARAASEERMRQFVADASHELRTPLTTIKGFAELYRQGASREPAETSALLRRIEGEASRMGLLVEDLLMLARLDQERPLTLAPVEMRALASDAVTAARVVAPDRTITLETGDKTALVIGDEPRLRQVIGNLMTNALAHTPRGTPIAVRVRDDGGSSVVLEVSDAGPGLTKEQQARVFERFYRVDKARTRQAAGTFQTVVPHSGSGLGLAIVAAIVSAHRGRVLVESTPGAGATFAVVLPKDQLDLSDEDGEEDESCDSVSPAESPVQGA